MSKRQRTPEGAIVAFFTETDLPVALALFRAVRGILDARGAFTLVAGRKARVVRRLKGEVPLPIDPPTGVQA
jgi:hypothetical protein